MSKHERKKSIEKDFGLLHARLTELGWFNEGLLESYWIDMTRGLSFLFLATFLVLRSRYEGVSLIPHVLRLSPTVCLFTGSSLYGLFLQQIAFMGHDAGHNSVTGHENSDFWLGVIVGNALSGVSVGWWKSTHNTHHIATNSVEDDPDIQHLPIFCFDEKLINEWSTYHEKYMSMDSIMKAMVRYQHLYFYPVLGFARFNLYIQSIIHLITTYKVVFKKQPKSSRTNIRSDWKFKASQIQWYAEVLTLFTFWALVVTLVCKLGAVNGAICLVWSHFVAGILHVQILLSHVAMDFCQDYKLSHQRSSSNHWDGTSQLAHTDDSEEVQFHEWQALSTMDILTPQCMNWFYGGLQYQLEHHLFPRLHRKNLPKLVPLIDEIMAKHNIPVKRLHFIDANLLVLRHMKRLGQLVADQNNPIGVDGTTKLAAS